MSPDGVIFMACNSEVVVPRSSPLFVPTVRSTNPLCATSSPGRSTLASIFWFPAELQGKLRL